MVTFNETLLTRSLVDSLRNSAPIGVGLEYVAIAKEHPLGVAVSALGVLVALTAYKIAKKATALRALNGPAANSFMWGHIPIIFGSTTSLPFQDELLSTYGSVCKMKGMMGEDQLWIADPRAMYDIVVKGHDDFQEPDGLIAFFKVVSGPSVITTTGRKHKIHRKILNPVFNVKHMRNLTPTITAITHHLEELVSAKARAGGGMTGIVDIYKWMNHVALEMIGQAGVGHSFGVMEGKEPAYLEASRQFLPLIHKMWYIRPVLPAMMRLGSARFRRFFLDLVPLRAPQELKNVADVMDEVAVGIYKQKKEAAANGTLGDQVAAGNDIITLLLKQNETVGADEQMTEDEAVSQVNALIFAGHDTTSGALARTLHLLAQHPDVQVKLRTEVREAHQQFGKDLDYDQLNSLAYLDAVCRESLRLHSPASMVERIAQQDWTLPLLYPIKSSDGKTMITQIPVKKGTYILLSIVAANRDKQTWGEDADEFRPSRWLKPLPQSVGDSKMPGVYSSLMTFLGGPRACLGFKFSQLEMKVVLSNLVSSFEFELGEDDITWNMDAVVKPHIRNGDGKVEEHPSLPMKIIVLG